MQNTAYASLFSDTGLRQRKPDQVRNSRRWLEDASMAQAAGSSRLKDLESVNFPGRACGFVVCMPHGEE